MAAIERLLRDCKELKRWHIRRRQAGVEGAGIEALACAIRERALKDAIEALREG